MLKEEAASTSLIEAAPAKQETGQAAKPSITPHISLLNLLHPVNVLERPCLAQRGQAGRLRWPGLRNAAPGCLQRG